MPNKNLTGENLSQAPWTCVCSLTVMPSPWSNVRCRTVFFQHGLQLELQTAPCESISHTKVHSVTQCQCPHWHADSDIVTKGASVQAARPWQFPSHGVSWAKDNFHLSCMTSLSITKRVINSISNWYSNGMQWKSPVSGFTNDFVGQDLDLAGLP